MSACLARFNHSHASDAITPTRGLSSTFNLVDYHRVPPFPSPFCTPWSRQIQPTHHQALLISLTSPTKPSESVSTSKRRYDTAIASERQMRSIEYFCFLFQIGFGNWGSVWLCSPKSQTSDGFDRLHRNRLAVKLVHRHPNDPEKSKTTAARVKSLYVAVIDL